MGFAKAQPILRSRPQTSPDRLLAGIGWMLAGIAIFSINDALGKWLLLDYSVGELLLIRSAAALVVLVPFLRKTGVAAFVTAPQPALQIARIVLSALEVAMFFWRCPICRWRMP